MRGLKRVFVPDDFAFEVCGQGWVVVGKACAESAMPAPDAQQKGD